MTVTIRCRCSGDVDFTSPPCRLSRPGKLYDLLSSLSYNHIIIIIIITTIIIIIISIIIGISWVRVIPPLRGLEREVKCSWCNVTLFTLASVLHGLDDQVNMSDMIDTLNTDCEGTT